MTPEQYRQRKDDLIRREHEARSRAQRSAVDVVAAKESGDDGATETALHVYDQAVAELEALMHETGEYD